MNPFIHESARVLGDVTLGHDTSVWPMAVIRGDVERIVIGERCNVQDGAVIHADPGIPTIIGNDCVIGHRAIVHGTTLGNGVLVGMGAILLNHVNVGAGSMIGAGSVCKEGMQIPPGVLVVGVPARVVRTLTPEDQAGILENASRYAKLARHHDNGEIVRHAKAGD